MKKALSVVLCAALLAPLASCSAGSSKKEADIDYTTLDTTWECDYLKISTNSNWNVEDNLDYGSIISVHWDKNGTSPIFLTISYMEYYKKLTQYELIKKWEAEKHSEDASIDDTFVKNGQAYIVTKNKSDIKNIEFCADKLHGSFSFYADDEDYVLKMIDSIVFY